MKIKTQTKKYEDVMALPKEAPFVPQRPGFFFRKLMQVLSAPELKKVGFTFETEGLDEIGTDEPCIILMNHSSFIDLMIAETVFADRPFNIVCTSDGFVGKKWLMKKLGCMPTQKFVTDVALLKNMKYSLEKLRCSVLLYPEASYSFDGTATPLPKSVGKCLKMMGVPVIMIRTYGAFQRDPLYNNLQVRDVTVSAKVYRLLTREETKSKTVPEINDILKEAFSFDNFRWQQENNVIVDEPFRADYLHRVLYKCPHCMSEDSMLGKGTEIRCCSCGVKYELTENGFLDCKNATAHFNHIPDWYRWQRSEVRKELKEGTYSLDIPVRIGMLVDTKSIYFIGEGRLTHNADGFHLCSDDKKLEYRQGPKNSYSLYSDYFWYEIGDVICIGDNSHLYYCFPTGSENIAAKTRIATEELFSQ